MALSTEPQSGKLLTYHIDQSHSCVSFSVRYMMLTTIRGLFGQVDGTIQLDPTDLALSSVTATIDATKINTNDPVRDAYLRGADSLNTDQFPTITFQSTRLEPLGENTGRMVGDLTMRGVTLPVELDVEYAGAGVHVMTRNAIAGFSATGVLSRKDFEMGWNVPMETGGWALSDDVRIQIDIQAIQETEEGATSAA